ncbi:MAG: Stk1 family PASTA domain-containing Ser/Thr kinase [Clostridiales bacterium]|nr:Stk1 family PASTA domain-containing Ser/Thr kinase [Clostridiales bacterium]
MDKYIGRRLDGRYLVDELVGIGGMANVYKATDVSSGRTVAVKILRDEYVQNQELLRRFKNESKAVALLSHPNIVKVYDVNFSEKVNYIVMEYIDGITLKEYIEHKGALSWKESVYFTVQILRALQHAHDNGIVHRDIKPQNIMLLKDGSIKVTDFGIARFARSGMHTMTDKAIGSVHYISPEQAKGDVTDDRADLYSVGVMMYEMLTGRLPFEAESAVSVAIKHIEEAPRPPRSINSEIPEGLESIVLRAMQKNAADRYSSAAEMLRDIDSFKKDPSISFEYRYRTPSGPASEALMERAVSGVQSEQSEGKKSAGGKAALFGSRKKNTRGPARGEKNTAKKPSQTRRRVAAGNEQLAEDAKKNVRSGQSGNGLLTVLVGITCAFIIGSMIFVGTMFVLNNPFERVADVTVPALVGLDYESIKDSEEYKDITIVVEESGYNEQYPAGQIYEQSPSQGRTVKVGSSVSVKVSLGTELATVPDVLGKEAAVAESELIGAGFTVQRVDVYNDLVPSGLVCGTNPGGSSQVPAGIAVKMEVSMGPETATTTVPDLGGEDLDTARDLLEEAGLSVGNITYRANESDTDTVIGQSPSPSSEVSEGSYVDLTLSSGDRDISTVQLYVALPEEITGTVSVTAEQDGEVVLRRQLQPSLTKVWKPTFSGSGVAEVEIFIDGASYRTYEVDFDAGTSTQLS